MGEQPPRRLPSQTTRLPIVKDIVEPPAVAKPVPRTRTPIGLPAPPHGSAEESDRRQSYDDLEQVLQVERLERERAKLLVDLQDAKDAQAAAERQARQLRTPVAVFPPLSIPPPAEPKSTGVESIDIDFKALEKTIARSKLGRAAVGLGILVALGWNAFNSVRAPSPEKVAAVQERITQSDKARDDKLVQDALEKQRTLLALRAIYCWGKQLRGASARQGLDLPSLPPGGVTALRLDQGDPSKAPAFVAAEKCRDFPPLPPELPASEP